MRQNGRKDDGDIRRKRTPSRSSHESIVQRSAQKQRRWKIIDPLLCRPGNDYNFFRTITSVNQFSLYEAVAEMCEEYEPFHEKTGKPVVGGQSCSSFVPSMIKTNVLLNNDDHAHKDLPLQRDGKRIEKLSQQKKIEQILYGCRIPECF